MTTITNKFAKLFTIAMMMVFFTANINAGDKYESKDVKKKDIVTIALENGSFNTLAAALTAADLVETLKTDGPFTVFAPTDEAFAKLPKGTVESLLKDKKALTNILLYHVVSGNVSSDAVVKLSDATTLAKSDVKINVKNGKVFINESQVTTADVKASNGVIHIIDTVLLPSKNRFMGISLNK